jgi:hypothetical protein
MRMGTILLSVTFAALSATTTSAVFAQEPMRQYPIRLAGESALFHVMHSVTLVGFVGADPEQPQVGSNGSKFTALSLAN